MKLLILFLVIGLVKTQDWSDSNGFSDNSGSSEEAVGFGRHTGFMRQAGAWTNSRPVASLWNTAVRRNTRSNSRQLVNSSFRRQSPRTSNLNEKSKFIIRFVIRQPNPSYRSVYQHV
ncbi:Hypothetical predicted protein [Mytilus galloprovincialis]|nr:Hypothetical predicted protein [Mytilus galloprovincialis]